MEPVTNYFLGPAAEGLNHGNTQFGFMASVLRDLGDPLPRRCPRTPRAWASTGAHWQQALRVHRAGRGVERPAEAAR
jgi:hypothetical protein